MKTENKIFWGGSFFVIVAAFAYIGYINIGSSSGHNPSDMAFSNSPNAVNSRSLEQGKAQSNVERASTQSSAPTTQQEVSPQGALDVQVTSTSSGEKKNTGSDIIQDPVPVPPAERDGGEVAQALRNLRIQSEGIQQRLMEHGQDLRSLQQQVTEITQDRRDHQESLDEVRRALGEVQRANEALRSELSGKALYAQSSSEEQAGSEKRDGKGNGYQLIKLFEDKAWIHTPQGRTYIVGEGDWFGSEYVISINRSNNAVITSAGELVL